MRFTDDALRAAVELSDRYLTERVLPDKAIDLIDQAGARLRLRLGVQVDTQALVARLAELEADKNAAVSAEKYEEASRIRDQITEVQARLQEATARPSADAVVGEPEIAAVISGATGIPAARLTETERERLANARGRPPRARDRAGRGRDRRRQGRAAQSHRHGRRAPSRRLVPVPRPDGCRQDRAREGPRGGPVRR